MTDEASVAPAALVPPPVDEALARCAEVLTASQRILLTSHRRPDGDGSGSMVGLAVMLRAWASTRPCTAPTSPRAGTSGCP